MSTPSSLTCPRCGYNLCGLTLRAGAACPECGATADWVQMQATEAARYRRKLACFSAGMAPSPLAVSLLLIFTQPGANLGNSLFFAEVLAGAFVISWLCFTLAMRLDRKERGEPRAWVSEAFTGIVIAMGYSAIWVCVVALAR